MGSSEFDAFCAALNKPPFGFNHTDTEIAFGDDKRTVILSGGLALDYVVLNYAKYIKEVSFTVSDNALFTNLENI